MTVLPDFPEAPHPDWVGPKTELVAMAVDVVSGDCFRAWYDNVEAARPRSRLRRNRARPLLVEDVGTGSVVARLSSWAEAVDWHDRTLISTGWRVLSPQAEVDGRGALAVGGMLEPHPPR